jgi:TorA maturation chaperone TorD
MSLNDYQESQQIGVWEDWTFYALIMAAMRKADDENLAKLESVFPETLAELRARYNAPGGALNEAEREFVERQQQRRRAELNAEFDELFED